jgi:hypothetical protein
LRISSYDASERLVTGFGGRRCGGCRHESPSLSLVQGGPIEFPDCYTAQQFEVAASIAGRDDSPRS